MASGDTLLTLNVGNAHPTQTAAATYEPLTGGSSPAETFPRYAFDDTTVEYLDFHGLVLPEAYAGGGLTVSIRWGAAAATNKGIWAAAIRRHNDDGEDLSASHSYSYQDTGDIDPPSGVGEEAYDDITFTNGAQMDNLAAGESFNLRLRRPAPSGTKITGDMYFYELQIKET